MHFGLIIGLLRHSRAVRPRHPEARATPHTGHRPQYPQYILSSYIFSSQRKPSNPAPPLARARSFPSSLHKLSAVCSHTSNFTRSIAECGMDSVTSHANVTSGQSNAVRISKTFLSGLFCAQKGWGLLYSHAEARDDRGPSTAKPSAALTTGIASSA